MQGHYALGQRANQLQPDGLFSLSERSGIMRWVGRGAGDQDPGLVPGASRRGIDLPTCRARGAPTQDPPRGLAQKGAQEPYRRAQQRRRDGALG